MNLSKKLETSIYSGLIVSLVALPLCLGIAVASGFPAVSGLITAIIAGLVATHFGSAPLTIKGPAAGLIVIVLSSVQELGGGDPILGFKSTLAVGVAAGLIQVVLGFLKAGRFAALAPSAVIHGMLATIGVSIICKQLHTILGVIPQSKSPFELLYEIPHSLANLNPAYTLVGLMGVAVLFAFAFLPILNKSKVPAPLAVVLCAIPMAIYFKLGEQGDYTFLGHIFSKNLRLMVTLPSGILAALSKPNFYVLKTVSAWKYVFLLTAVGSIESLLTVQASQLLKKNFPKQDLNKDLISVGVGNVVSSMMGGLPMISEILRTRVNIDSGAESRWSNFFHSLFLLSALLAIPTFLQKIPLSALAAVLIFTGFRLCSPKLMYNTYLIGMDQFMYFLTTMVVSLKTDLLVGVASGICLKLLVHSFRGLKVKNFFKAHIEEKDEGKGAIVMQVDNALVFSNYYHLHQKIIDRATNGKRIVLDFSRTKMIDHTTMEKLQHLKDEFATTDIQISGIENLSKVSKHELATRLQ